MKKKEEKTDCTTRPSLKHPHLMNRQRELFRSKRLEKRGIGPANTPPKPASFKKQSAGGGKRPKISLADPGHQLGTCTKKRQDEKNNTLLKKWWALTTVKCCSQREGFRRRTGIRKIGFTKEGLRHPTHRSICSTCRKESKQTSCIKLKRKKLAPQQVPFPAQKGTEGKDFTN